MVGPLGPNSNGSASGFKVSNVVIEGNQLLPVKKMPSNVPAPPMEATGAPRSPMIPRFMRSAPISVPMDPVT